MSILKEIINKRKLDIQKLRKKTFDKPINNKIDFAKLIKRAPQKKLPNLIAEIKRRSPSLGDLHPNLSVIEAIDFFKPYAAALSILTEPNYFNGKLEDLQEASQLTSIPLLRKDFIVDEVQITQARHAGANAYLLIVAAMEGRQLSELMACGKELQMEALVEVHNEKELEIALQNNVKLLGINNRDLHTLNIDLQAAHRILSEIPDDLKSEITIVAESGYSKKSELMELPYFVDAVLMGTTFMKSPNPKETLQKLFAP